MIVAENKYTFQKEYFLRYNEMDYNKVLKPSALLNFLQDIATENADTNGFGYDIMKEKNYAWFLLKYTMEFYDYPEKVQELIVKTEPTGYQKFFAHRDFELVDKKDGKLLGRAQSLWTIVDLKDKSMIMPGDVFPQMPIFQKREDDMKFEKIKPLERVDFQHSFDIRFDDIDVNHHVNNTNYIIWAFEALPFEFKSKHKLKKLDMLYKKEIAFGHKVLSEVQIDGLTTTHVVKNADTGEELCTISATYQLNNQTGT